jgi:Histidine kinase-, DNA gyrase B-, and HSP90-like ATPase
MVAIRPDFRQIAVRYEHAGVTEGRFDPGGLQQVITNVVLNACEAVSPVSGRVEVTSLGRWDCLEIRVSDNGPGIPEPIRHVVFQPFVSCDKAGGTGLGLAIAQKILHDQGGEIYLDATDEKGTVFRLILPFHGPDRDSSTLNESRSEINLSGTNRQRAKIPWADHSHHLRCSQQKPESQEQWLRGRRGVGRSKRQARSLEDVHLSHLNTAYKQIEANLLAGKTT